MDGYDALLEQLKEISSTTETLLAQIGDLRLATNERLDNIETELDNTKRQQQQAILLLTELAAAEDDAAN